MTSSAQPSGPSRRGRRRCPDTWLGLSLKPFPTPLRIRLVLAARYGFVAAPPPCILGSGTG
jgi:hypothetical protein